MTNNVTPTVDAPDVPERSAFDTVEAAVARLAAGGAVIVVDDASRENEGDVVVAAQSVTARHLAFMMTECRGLVCAALAGDLVDRLALPPMAADNTERHGTAFTVSVDAREGTTTGISAADRARTLRVLADPATGPDDLRRPGHVFPLRAVDGGLAERRGHTEASVELVARAGLRPAAVICEIANADGTMARLPELLAFARRHGLPIVSVADIADIANVAAAGDAPGARDGSDRAAGPATAAGAVPVPGARTSHAVTRVGVTRLPTEHGDFSAVGYLDAATGHEHVALVAGDLRDGRLADGDDVLVRLHSECLTGDAFGSLRCDCGPQLDASLDAITAEGRGVVVYLDGHEGRGIGLLSKLRAYALQDEGHDTVEANLRLGLPADARDYGAAAAILDDLGVRGARMLTNNPTKIAGITAHGVVVTRRVGLPTHITGENVRYLRTKRDRMGHDLPWLAATTDPAAGPARRGAS